MPAGHRSPEEGELSSMDIGHMEGKMTSAMREHRVYRSRGWTEQETDIFYDESVV